MGGLSVFHWLIIGIIVILLFGNRLPSVMRSLGQGMVEFKKGFEGIEDERKSRPAEPRYEAPAAPAAPAPAPPADVYPPRDLK
jgi:sec-independent protein translocase protein TatA